MREDPLYSYACSAQFYDALDAYAKRADIRFYLDEAVRSGGPVLELGCGTGRVLIPTARAGVSIVGLDLSAAMLERCRARLAAEPADVQARAALRQGDMRRFDLGARFRLVTIPFRPFQHLEEVDDQLACLACIRGHLEPGGRLVLDLFNPSLHHIVDESKSKQSPDGPPFTLPDGRRVQRIARIVSQDLFRQVRYVELAYAVTHPDGRTEKLADRFAMRYTFRYELTHLLERSGFHVEAVYGGFDRSPFGATAYPGEIIAFATRS